MRIAVFGAFAFFIGCSIGDAAQPPDSTQIEVARFAAVSVSPGQGARAVISNLIESGKDTKLAPCQVEVRFFGPDGSLVGNMSMLQLKAGESRSVTASRAPQLLRTTISIDGATDAAKVCELKARVEIFDLQTGTTFISVAADPLDVTGECSTSSGRKLSRRKTAPLTLAPAVVPRR